MDAEKLILEYYEIRKEMLDTTKRIKEAYLNDTKPVKSFDGQYFTSNHLHDYFEYDKEWRSRVGVDGSVQGYDMEFSDYCCDVLGMDAPCPECSRILNDIRWRRKLAVKLGYTKSKIMRMGKVIAGNKGDTNG